VLTFSEPDEGRSRDVYVLCSTFGGPHEEQEIDGIRAQSKPLIQTIAQVCVVLWQTASGTQLAIDSDDPSHLFLTHWKRSVEASAITFSSM
jgi:hypothetical protein